MLESAPEAPPTVPKCRKCGYELTGLAEGMPCPECGTVFAGSQSRVAGRKKIDTLTDAPRGYLRLMTYSSALAAPGLVATLISSHYYASVDTLNNATVFAASVAAYSLGIGLATKKRPVQNHAIHDEVLDGPWFRLGVVVSQAVWIIAAIMALATAAQGGGGSNFGALNQSSALGQTSALGTVFKALQALGTIGIALQAIYFSSLADWAGDDGLAGRLRFTAWGLVLPAVVTPVLQVVAWAVPPLRFVLVIIVILMAVIAVVAVAVMMISMLQIPLMCFWALRYSVKADERDQRVAERRAKQAREDAERLANMPAPTQPDEPEPDRLAPAEFRAPVGPHPRPETPIAVEGISVPGVDGPMPKSTGEHRIERSGNGGTYELAD